MFSQNEYLLKNTLEVSCMKIQEGHGFVPLVPSTDAHDRPFLSAYHIASINTRIFLQQIR